MEKIYIYLSHNCYSFYLSEQEICKEDLYCEHCDEYDELYGVFEDKKSLNEAINKLLEYRFDALDKGQSMELLQKYICDDIIHRCLKNYEDTDSLTTINFEVMSRKQLEVESVKISETCVVISITDPYSDNVKIRENKYIKSVLRLSFADVGQLEQDAMTAEDAEKIEFYFAYWKERVSKVIVQCEARLSRSAGICAALMKKYLDDDSQIFDNPHYKPNMYCYNLLMNCQYENIWK